MHQVYRFSDGEILIFLSQLVASFGVRAAFDATRARENFKKGNFTQVLLEIKQHLGLNCQMRVGYVKGNLGAYLRKNCQLEPAFEKMLETYDEMEMKNPIAVTFQKPPPMIATPQFAHLQITLFIDRLYFQTRPFETFAVAVSHEMSHVILNSTFHPLKHIEAAVDILSMLLGFNEIAHQKTLLTGSLSGYLTLRQENLVYREIVSLIENKFA